MKIEDKYDRAIEYLTAHPEDIFHAWASAPVHEDETDPDIRGVEDMRCLFAATSEGCGCLTQIRCGLLGPTPEITEAIRADHRIPYDEREITVDDLPVFAEWQRKIDALNKEPKE
jgi:hypothetical protein